MKTILLLILVLFFGVCSGDCSESIWGISLEAKSRTESEIATKAITSALAENKKPFVVHKGLVTNIEVLIASKDELEDLVRDALKSLKREDIKSVRWWVIKSTPRVGCGFALPSQLLLRAASDLTACGRVRQVA